MKVIRWILGRIILVLDYLTRPRQMERTTEEQKKVDLKFKDHSIYQFQTCPFCVKIRRYMRRNSLNIELKDAKNNEMHRNELKVDGGKIQVPCLKIIKENNTTEWLYESADIIEYFDSKLNK